DSHRTQAAPRRLHRPARAPGLRPSRPPARGPREECDPMIVTVQPWPRGTPEDKAEKWMVYCATECPDGMQVAARKVVQQPSKKQVERWGWAPLQHLIDTRHVPKADVKRAPLVGELANEWVDKGLIDRKPQAIKSIVSILCLHIVPFIGDLRADEVTDK